MINSCSPCGRQTDFSIVGFFVMYPFRRAGVGRAAVQLLTKMHRGTWRLKYHPKNEISVKFRNSVVSEIAGGDYERIDAAKNAVLRIDRQRVCCYFAAEDG